MTADTHAVSSTSTGVAQWQTPALIIGIIGFAVSIAGWIVDPVGFYRGYLSSYIFWFDIAAGCLGVLMLQYVTGGEWGLMIRRPLGAAARTLTWMAALFIPVLLGMKALYPWMNIAWAQHDDLVRPKLGYLNQWRFVICAILYFALWLLWAWRIRILSLKFYKDRSPYTDLSRRKWAASGLPMFVLTMTFASIDWAMSLEPRWASTMYGITFIVGAGLSAFAFVTFFLSRLATTDAMKGILTPIHLRDLGNLMLTFVMFYAYTSFSEFMLIWYANIHEEIPYYIVRARGVWGTIAVVIIVFHFFLPFFMLLMRPIKDRAQTISVVTAIILVVRYVAVYWLIAPAFYGEHFYYSIWNFTTLIGIGGVWLYAFIGELKGQTIIPIHETWVEEAIREGALQPHA